jgi:hypothetical protein
MTPPRSELVAAPGVAADVATLFKARIAVVVFVAALVGGPRHAARRDIFLIALYSTHQIPINARHVMKFVVSTDDLFF